MKKGGALTAVHCLIAREKQRKQEERRVLVGGDAVLI